MNGYRFTIIKAAYGTSPAETTVLKHAPDGWDTAWLTLQKSADLIGIKREYSFELKFVKDGAELLRKYSYITPFLFNSVFLKIEVLDEITLQYSQEYYGQVNLYSFKDHATYASVEVEDLSLYSLLKKNGDIEYEFIVPYGETLLIDNGPGWYYAITIEQFAKYLVDKVTNGGITDNIYDITIDNSIYYIGSYSDIQSGYTAESNLMIGRQTYGTTNGFKIKCTFNKFIKSLQGLRDIGYITTQINNKEVLNIVQRKNCFDTTKIIETVDNVKDFSFYPSIELIPNKISIGYSEVGTADNDDIMKQEPNGKSIYETFLKNNKELDLVSEIPAAWTDITTAYQHLSDEKYANFFYWTVVNTIFDPFVGVTQHLVCHGTLKKDDNTYTGDCYNTEITPKRNLLNHIDYLRSILDQFLIYIAFSSSDVDNSNNITNTFLDMGLNYIAEFESIDITGAGAYFRPYIFEITCEISKDFYKNFKANNEGIVKFTYEEKQYSGFLLEAKIKPGRNCETVLKLLSTIDNDFSDLIR